MRLQCGQVDGEGAAYAWLAVDGDGAMVGVDDVADHGEADARAFDITSGGGGAAHEFLEDGFLLHFGNAQAMIADSNVDEAVLLVYVDPDGALAGGVFDGIIEQVSQGDGEGPGVDSDTCLRAVSAVSDAWGSVRKLRLHFRNYIADYCGGVAFFEVVLACTGFHGAEVKQ